MLERGLGFSGFETVLDQNLLGCRPVMKWTVRSKMNERLCEVSKVNDSVLHYHRLVVLSATLYPHFRL